MNDKLLKAHKRTARKHERMAKQALFDWSSYMGCPQDLIDFDRHAEAQQIAEGKAEAAKRLMEAW